MDLATLARVKEIAVALNQYGEKHTSMDFDSLVKFVKIKAKASHEEITVVIQFLQDIQGGAESLLIPDNTAMSIAERVKAFIEKPVNLADELVYNYSVAKALLNIIMERGTNPDSEEVRKTLREISRFSDSMLKLQERVYNIQQIQNFQEKVFQIIEDFDPDAKDQITALLLEADL